MKSLYYYDTPVGRIGLAEEAGELIGLYLEGDANDKLPQDATLHETALLKRAATQLREYFAGTRREFDLPLRLEGTPFQVTVWEALRTIPYGETRSYGEIAAHIAKPQAARAVGGANNRNPIAIFVP